MLTWSLFNLFRSRGARRGETVLLENITPSENSRKIISAVSFSSSDLLVHVPMAYGTPLYPVKSKHRLINYCTFILLLRLSSDNAQSLA